MPLKLKCLVTSILFFPFLVFSQGYDPCNPPFQNIYSSDANEELHDMEETTDGGIITVGVIGNTTADFLSNDALIMKLDRMGEIIWAKRLGGLRADHFKRVKQTNDGGYIAVGQTGSFGTEQGSIFVVKFGPLGNISWAKAMGKCALLLERSYDVLEITTGGFAITGVHSMYGTDDLVVIRTDPAGNVLWEKNFDLGNGIMSLSSGVVEHNDSLVIAGSFAEALGQSPDKRTFIAKLNKDNGNVGWNWQWYAGARFGEIYKKNGIIYLSHVSVSGHVSFSKFDGNGNRLTTFLIPNTPISPGLRFCPSNDDGVILSYGTNLMKIKPDNTLQWGYNYNGYYVNLGRIKHSTTNQILGVGWKGNYGNNDLVMFKRNEDGTDNCLAGPSSMTFTTVFLQPIPYSFGFHSDPVFDNLTVTPTITDVNFATTYTCYPVASSCTSLSITGSDTACLSYDTLTFIGQRAPGCVTPVQFQIDPSKATIISVTDTTATISFKQPGLVSLYAKIGSCGVSSDSISIYVNDTTNTLNLGLDEPLCQNSLITLKAGKGFRTYTWQDGSTDSLLLVTVPGVYHVKVTNCSGRIFFDTINIWNAPPAFLDIGRDSLKCSSDTLEFTATSGFDSYSWGPAHNISSLSGQTIRVWPSVDTVYTLSAVNSIGCIASDSIQITVHKPTIIDLGHDTTVCNGSAVRFDAGPGFINYLWNTGASSSDIIVGIAGEFWVVANDLNNCKSSDTISITSVRSNPINFVTNDTSICDLQPLVLRSNTPYSKYLWSTGAISSQITISSSGKYWLQVTAVNGCTSKEFIDVLPKDCAKVVHIPSAFSPNGDFVNDIFRAIAYGSLKSFRIILYNRFGEKVFESNDVNKGWDGRYKNAVIDSGVFAWFVEYQFINEEIKREKGTVMLIR